MTNKGMWFSFSYTTQEKSYKTLKIFGKKETCQESDVPVKITKSHNGIFPYFKHHNFNNPRFISVFTSELKEADVIYKHKKRSEFDIENYCLVSILPFSSKIYYCPLV